MFHFRKAAIATLLSLASVLPAAALDRRVVIVNNSAYTIEYMYATNKGDSSFGDFDILGSDVLPPGYNITVNFDDGSGYCVFDIRVVLEGGATDDAYGINVCEISTYTYY
jgi:hypothetical protein